MKDPLKGPEEEEEGGKKVASRKRVLRGENARATGYARTIEGENECASLSLDFTLGYRERESPPLDWAFWAGQL